MPKAIRIKIFQQMPNYKKPASVVLKESFPLPPYSTVIGMVHNACKFTEYHPMKVSVQGVHISEIAEIEKQYTFGSIPNDRCDVIIPSFKTGIRSGMKTIQFLTDVNLCIHIMPENEDEIEFIYESLLNPDDYISLGRREDIARIDEVSIVDLIEVDSNSDEIDDIKNIYERFCPVEYLGDSVYGTIYKIPKVFGYSNKNRRWSEVINSVNIAEGNDLPEDVFDNENVFVDIENGNSIAVVFA